jgi:hypothetical protein
MFMLTPSCDGEMGEVLAAVDKRPQRRSGDYVLWFFDFIDYLSP